MIFKLIAYLILTVSGLFLFKKGGNTTKIQLSLSEFSLSLSLTTLLGIICYGISFILWLNIIKNNKLSYIYPVANGLVTVMTILGGVFLFKEKIFPVQVIGIILIIVGVILVYYKR